MKFYKKNHNRFLDEATVISTLQMIPRRIRSKVNKFTRRTGNLITWAPIIWKDEQWDHDWFLIILDKKFKRMRSYWLEETNAPLMTSEEHKEKVLKDLNEGIRLIAAMRENDYGADLRAAHDEQWGKIRWKRVDNGQYEPEHKITYRFKPVYNIIRPVIRHIGFIHRFFVKVDLGFKANTQYNLIREKADGINGTNLELERAAYKEMLEKIAALEIADRKALGELISRCDEWWD